MATIFSSIFDISEERLINSNHFRHIHADKILAVSHPWYNKGRILMKPKITNLDNK